jgi:outer membrane protein assembly factor BamB
MDGGRISRRDLLRTGAASIMAACAGCFGPEKDGVYALSRTDGSERWVNTLGAVDGGPTLFDDTVVVGSGSTVSALATGDGEERWSYDVEFEYTNDIKDPVLFDETLLVPAGKELYALSAADGSEQWTVAGDAEMWLIPRPVDGTVVVGAGKERLRGLSLEDGAERWTYEGGALDRNAATVADGTAFVGSRDGRVIAIDVTDGSERWTFDTEKPVRGGMAVHSGHVYPSTTGNRVYALTTGDGTERWQWKAPAGGEIMPLGASWPSTMGLGQSLYAAYAGRLFALSTSDGTEQWRTVTELTSMVLQQSGDTIFVTGDGLSDTGGGNSGPASYGALQAFRQRDGRERWSETFTEDLEHPPVIGESTVFAGTEEGMVHAFEKRDGSEAWTFETETGRQPGVVLDGDTVYVGTLG